MSQTSHSNDSAGTEKKTAPSHGPRNSDAQESGRAAEHKTGMLRRIIFGLVYITFLVAVVLALFGALEYYAYLQIKNSPIGAAYRDRNLDLARQSSVTARPLFGYEPTPGFATIRNTKLGNSYEYITEQGFKEFNDVPLQKPANEYRVFVTGGSVVFGRGPVPPTDAITDYYEVTYRWNIPHMMEKLLNADPRIREKIGGKTVRVINAGVAGFVIQNNLMRYLAKLRLYKPDLVVSLDGANEVHTVARPLGDWNYFTEGQYQQIVSEVLDMSRKGLLSYLALWLKRNTYFFTWLALRRGEGTGIIDEQVGFSPHPLDPTPEMLEYRKRNIDQVADVEAIYHKVLETDGVPHVLALQPMLRNCKKPRTPLEVRIDQMTGMQKIGFYDARETYELLVNRIMERGKEVGIDIVDLTEIFGNVKDWVWTDWCHLTNGANYLIAKALVNRVKTDVFGLALLPDDVLKEPLDSYLNDYSKSARVIVHGKPVDEGNHILKGYPGTEILQVTAKEEGNPGTLIVDLGEVRPISRLRIVWGDKGSVPRSWRLEVSEDGKTWKNWLTITDTQTDAFDQWPGFEYYDTKETAGRYVRYMPSGENSGKKIVLRQLSLFR